MKPRDTPRGAVTPWFPADVHPVRVGVYQVSDGCTQDDWYAYWDGMKFGWRSCMGARDAYEDRDSPTCCPGHVEWRGLAKEPK